MALTPVGPFCPFRSAAAEALDPPMEDFNDQGPDFATEMARFNLDMQMGHTPEPERLRRVAQRIDQAVDQWETLVARLRTSSDFQTREYAKLTEAHLSTHGQSVEGLGAMMRWQAGCMRAMADDTPPPMPPVEIDLAKMMEQAQHSDKPSPSINAMTAAQQITAPPFEDPKVLESSPTVKLEYEALCRDHQALIDFGAKYNGFDPLGKIAYLNEVEKIQERWDVFFARFSLMGALNQKYLLQCKAFLESMGMSEADYKDL